MRKFLTAGLIVTLSAVFPSLAAGQQNNARMHAEAEVVELLLLRQKSVRDELGIDGAQGKTISQFTHQQHLAARKVHKLPQGQQQSKWEDMIKENQEFLTKNLTAQQRKRLKQICLQTAGLLMVTQPSIARELNLTPRQKQRARQMQKDAREKMDQILEGKDRDRQREKLAELHNTTKEQLASLLTDEQKIKWRELAGTPFKGRLELEQPER